MITREVKHVEILELQNKNLINSQSFKDAQVGYISQKYTLDKYNLKNKLWKNKLWGTHFEKIHLLEHLSLHALQKHCRPN